MSRDPIRIAVLVSGKGRGTNMQAIIDACKSGKINGEVALVLGVKGDAPAMERAGSQGLNAVAISPKDYRDTQDYDDAVLRALKDQRIDLVCLAGYMRLLGIETVRYYRNRIMNVHPALIPMFAGKGMYGHHVHEAAIERGVKFTGVTVHYVDEEYDRGPIILQRVVAVEDDDTADTLSHRVLKVEHEAYTSAIALFAQDRLEVVDHKVRIRPTC